MVLIAFPDDEPEKDKPQSKLAKLINAAEGLKATRDFALSRAEQSFASEAKRIASILGPSAMYARSLSQELSDINRAMGQVASLSSLNYNKIFQPPNFTEAIQSLTVAQGLAWGVPKQLFESQFALQQQVEACINTYETACGVLLRDQHSLRDSLSAIQTTLNSAGIAKEFFQDSYSKTVRAVLESYLPTQSFLADSISRVFEREGNALRAAAQLAAQGLPKDLLANTQAIFDHRNFAFEATLIQKAIAPFVREWGWLVCEAKLVSVDIKHDGDHFLYAEYDRETVIELLTARFALEETQPEVSISSSGELELPHDLLECSGEHSTHSAHYHGETILDSEDNEIKKKALSQCLDELRRKGIFDEETWDQIETDARRAEKFARGLFADVMHIAMLYVLELATLYVKENPLSAEEFRAHQEKAFARLRKLLPKPDEGRPKGTGLFRDEDEFLTALKDVLQKAPKKLSQRQALHAIRQHPLCQKQTADFPSQNETKTLRNWLDKCGMKYKDALEKYWKPAQKGK